jgi:signal transduction histidine kinase
MRALCLVIGPLLPPSVSLTAENVSQAAIAALLLIALLVLALNPRDQVARIFTWLLLLSGIVAESSRIEGQIPFALYPRVVALGLLPITFVVFCDRFGLRHLSGRSESVACLWRRLGIAIGVGAWIASGIYLIVPATWQLVSIAAHAAALFAPAVALVAGLGLLVLPSWRTHADGKRHSRMMPLVVAGGAVVAFGPLIALSVVPDAFGLPPVIHARDISFTLFAFPLAVGFASVRWRPTSLAALADRRSVSMLLALFVLAAYAGLTLLAERVVERLLPIAEWALPLALVALAAATYVPLRHALQSGIDALLYRDHFELGVVLEQFSQELATLPDQDAVINLLLDGLVNTLNLSAIAFVSLPEGLDPRVLALLEPEDLRARREYATTEGRMEVVRGLASCAALASKLSPEYPLRRDPWPGCAALVLVGPRSGDGQTALLVIGEKRNGGVLRHKDRALLVTLAHHGATALANAVLVRGLRVSLAQLQAFATQLDAAWAEQRLLARELLSADERQRAALARDLHDDALQEVLYTVRHSRFSLRLAQSLQVAPSATSGQSTPETSLPSGAGGIERLRLELTQLVERSVAAERKLRALCLGLYPELLHTLGLAAALEDLAAQMEPLGLDVTLDCAPAVAAALKDLEARIALHIYRITQEALTNAAKHAGARVASVTLRREESSSAPVGARGDGWVIVEIDDDGRGMALPVDYEALLRAGHLGLAGMRQRAEDVGAWLDFSASQRGGLYLRLAIPLDRSEQLATRHSEHVVATQSG